MGRSWVVGRESWVVGREPWVVGVVGRGSEISHVYTSLYIYFILILLFFNQRLGNS